MSDWNETIQKMNAERAGKAEDHPMTENLKPIPEIDAAVDFVMQRGGRCRDCADCNGFCQDKGLPCDPDHARNIVRIVLEAVSYGQKHWYLATRTPPEASEPGGEVVAWQERERFHGVWGPWLPTSEAAFLEWQQDPSLHEDHEARALGLVHLAPTPDTSEAVAPAQGEWLRCTECANLIHPDDETIIGEAPMHKRPCAENWLDRAEEAIAGSTPAQGEPSEVSGLREALDNRTTLQWTESKTFYRVAVALDGQLIPAKDAREQSLINSGYEAGMLAALRTGQAVEAEPVAIPRLENCGTYIAKDNKENWHYLNHAGQWCGYQGPVSPPDTEQMKREAKEDERDRLYQLLLDSGYLLPSAVHAIFANTLHPDARRFRRAARAEGGKNV